MWLLALVRERTEHSQPIIVTDLANACEFTATETEAAWAYLKDHRLIDTFRLPLSAKINAKGIDVLDEAKNHGPIPPKENFANPALKGARIRGYGRSDSAEGLDRAREITKELERLHAVLPLISDPELSAYSTQSLSIGTFLQSKGHTFSVLTEEMLAQEFKRELERRKESADRRRGQAGSEVEHHLITKKRSRLEVASWIAVIVGTVIGIVALIVEVSKKGEHPATPTTASAIGQRQESGTQIGQVTGPVTIYNTSPAPSPAATGPVSSTTPAPKMCAGERTLTFAPQDPGVMPTDSKGRHTDLVDGDGGTRLEKWIIRWDAPARVTSVKCSGQRNERVLEENKDGNHAECSGSINGGNDALSMHVAWDGPCDQPPAAAAS
jgi:hypothetical protein